jgi:hypothetical protein
MPVVVHDANRVEEIARIVGVATTDSEYSRSSITRANIFVEAHDANNSELRAFAPWVDMTEPELRRYLAARGFADDQIDDAIALSRACATGGAPVVQSVEQGARYRIQFSCRRRTLPIARTTLATAAP